MGLGHHRTTAKRQHKKMRGSITALKRPSEEVKDEQQ
jgi:hypothetical protein